MLTNSLAAVDQVWLPIIDARENAEDSMSLPGIQDIVSLYEHAEADYLSIPVLQRHLRFLVSRHAHLATLDPKPENLEGVFTTEWTFNAMLDVVNKGVGHLTQGHLLWDTLRDWALETLESATGNDRQILITRLDSLYINRLQQPHSNSDETFQSYSTFTTNHKPPQAYETLLVTASKLRARAVKSYQRREASEFSLAQSDSPLDVYSQYIASERRAKNPDLSVVTTLYERAIAEAASRRHSGELNAEEALRMLWVGYCDSLRILRANAEVEHQTYRRAVRSVPAAGEVWARYIRYLERVESKDETRESIADVFSRALDMNMVQSEVEQIVPLFLARAGFDKRQIEAGIAAPDDIASPISILEYGVELVNKASPHGDPRLRLEKYLSEIYASLSPEDSITVTKTAARRHKGSYSAWIAYTDVLLKNDRHDEARATFKDLCMKNLDWPEAIWEAWISFEHLHGSVDDIESCLDKIEKARYQVDTRRAKEAEKATQQEMQFLSEQQPIVMASVDADVDMKSTEGDAHAHDKTGGTKRKAEGTPVVEDNKKAKIEHNAPPPKRDRENSTVFVADLQSSVTEGDVRRLFKDCGQIREIKIIQSSDSLVATVEFLDRESVPAALTKDKKRLNGTEVAVHLAWKSTLYVTNFPEKVDDAFMRGLFEQYGTIFEIRWPSKKFKDSRRFCYVQYVSPESATHALELHGRALEEGHAMSVFISNPNRKKERTDADANDREVYVAGLSKFTTKDDLENLFRFYGNMKEVRIATGPDGSCKGFAFVEFEEEKHAQAALSANNHELKKRRIAVTLADSRVRARRRNVPSDTGLSRPAEVRSRSVRIRKLPKGTQEGLLQQTVEKYAVVKRVEVFSNLNEATVELENAAEAGKLLLRTEPIIFGEHTLELTEEISSGPARSSGGPGMFVPRAAVPKPRARMKHNKPTGTGSSQVSATSDASSSKGGKGQDDFRKMLLG